MKKLLAFLTYIFTQSCTAQTPIPADIDNSQSIHQFQVEDIEGGTFDLASLKGKKVILVNTASKCGLTPQYKDLVALYDQYKDQGLVIIGFPANNFMSQEPGTNQEIAEFCQRNYGVPFPMMAKISVKGKDQAPLYQFLTQKKYNGVLDTEISWNFQKFLIDENGKVVKTIAPKQSIATEEVKAWITSK